MQQQYLSLSLSLGLQLILCLLQGSRGVLKPWLPLLPLHQHLAQALLALMQLLMSTTRDSSTQKRSFVSILSDINRPGRPWHSGLHRASDAMRVYCTATSFVLCSSAGAYLRFDKTQLVEQRIPLLLHCLQAVSPFSEPVPRLPFLSKAASERGGCSAGNMQREVRLDESVALGWDIQLLFSIPTWKTCRPACYMGEGDW